ncbi:hypothetical protein TruAng_005949 [Truncatella angustata]|nr:hypothetical protein TruAng_005949 [Truncatella angustata]
MLQQQKDDSFSVVSYRDMHHAAPVVVNDTGVCVFLQEDPDHVNVPVFGTIVQRSPPLPVYGINIGPPMEQNLEYLVVPHGRADV